MPAPFLQLRGRPLSLPCKQATSLGPAEERPLVPGAGRAGQPQQATQHCCLVPPGGLGRARPLVCGDPRTLRVSQKCIFPASLPNQYFSTPTALLSCLLCPRIVQDSLLPFLGISLFLAAHWFPTPRCSEAPGSSSPIWGLYAKLCP